MIKTSVPSWGRHRGLGATLGSLGTKPASPHYVEATFVLGYTHVYSSGLVARICLRTEHQNGGALREHIPLA